MKRALWIILSLVVAAAVIGGGVFWVVSRAGTSRLEAWIGGQLQEIANSYLNPRLSFSDLDYSYPGTVSLQNFRLSAQDPSEPGKTLDIIAADRATIMLAKVPRVGEPIAIERIVLDRPLFSAIAVAPHEGKLVGFSDFVRKDVMTTRPTTKRTRLSDILAIRLIQVNNGRIVYDPRIRGTDPMELDQIDTKLDVQPTEAGWYKLGTDLSRRPLFDISAAGQLNLDSFAVRDVAIKLTAELSPGTLNYLPPQIQKFLNRYEVRGAIHAMMMGDLPMTHPKDAEFGVDLTLSDANVTLGEYRIPVDRLDLTMRMEDRMLALANTRVEALHGLGQLWGTIDFEEPQRRDSTLEMKVMGMLLQDLLAAKNQGEPPKFAGKVDGDAQVNVPMRILRQTVRGRTSGELPENWGKGTLQLTEGRLIRIPVFQKMSEAIRKAAKMVGVGSDTPTYKDRLNLTMTGAGDRINYDDVTFIGTYVAARGKGSMTVADHRLDLMFNAGPIEKMQQLLGQHIGGAIATVTDKVLSYRVTGTFHEPQVKVEVAGGVVDGIGKTFDKIGEKIGDMVHPKPKQ